jgi:hypothetical protein
MNNLNGIISPCCNAFIHYIDNNCICTQCGRVIKKLDDEEELTTSIHYNASNKNVISADLLESEYYKDKRLAHDITCSLSTIKCDCGGLTRILRDETNKYVCVCTKCRKVKLV